MSLNLLTEIDDIVELDGQFYWVGDDSDIPDNMEIEDANMEVSNVPPFRSSIGIGFEDSKPYIPPYELNKINECEGIRRLDNEVGYLPDSKTRIYKRTNLTDEDAPDHILYRNEAMILLLLHTPDITIKWQELPSTTRNLNI